VSVLDVAVAVLAATLLTAYSSSSSNTISRTAIVTDSNQCEHALMLVAAAVYVAHRYYQCTHQKLLLLQHYWQQSHCY
jgi:hypothetical protein